LVHQLYHNFRMVTIDVLLSEELLETKEIRYRSIKILELWSTDWSCKNWFKLGKSYRMYLCDKKREFSLKNCWDLKSVV